MLNVHMCLAYEELLTGKGPQLVHW